MDLLCPCTNVVWTAYAHVRTEPQCDIGHTRGKKKFLFGVFCLLVTVHMEFFYSSRLQD